MNLQTHMSGQYSGQVPNQAGTSMPAMPPQQNMMQNSGGQHSILNMEPGFVKARRFIQQRIYDFLMQRQQTQVIAQKKVLDIVKRLEEGLFRTAASKEEYINLETLETRLHVLIKRLPLNNNNHNHQFQQQGNNTSVAVGTMIPTPGVSQSGNSSPNGGNTTGGMHSASFTSSDGGLTNGYQQSTANIFVRSNGNSLISSMGAQRTASQMIPTPGFNNNNSSSNNNNNDNNNTINNNDNNNNNGNSSSNLSYMHMDSSNNVGTSSMDSTMVSQPLQQKQQIGGQISQNSRILHNLGSHMGGGIRSSLHQKSYAVPNGSFNGGVGMPNGSGTSEGYLTGSQYGNPRPLPQHFDPPQRQMSHGDGYGSGPVNSSGSGNFYGPTTSGSSMMNNENMNVVNLQAIHKTTLPQMINQSTLHNTQQSPHFQQEILQDQNQQKQQSQSQIKPEPLLESKNEEFQSSMGANNFSQDTFVPMRETSNQFAVDPQNDLTQGQWKSNMSYDPNVVQEESNQRIAGNNLPNSGNLNRELQYKNQQRWLLFLRHARKCVHPPGKCPEPHCITAQKLWNHMILCKDGAQCKYLRCRGSKLLLNHHINCRDQSCPVCVYVKQFVQLKGGDTDRKYTMNTSPSVVETSEDLPPSMKKMKIEQPSQSVTAENENSSVPEALQDSRVEEHQVGDSCVQIKSEVKEDYIEDLGLQKSESGFSKEFVKTEKEVVEVKEENDAPIGEVTKSGKPKIKGVSMMELFTPEQVREHIMGLRQWVGQSKAKVEKNQAMENSINENSCQLCAVEKLAFEPPPIYCTPCGARIKRNAMFYTVGTGDTRHYFCIPCYNETRGDTINVDGTNISKARMEKKKNDEETEEWWVQCDKCEAWQHQICALFNGKRNDGGQAEYTCPNCYVEEVERGERTPLLQNAVLGAKDLPRTILSDHIENRLFKKLKHERMERARFHGKSFNEVPGAEALVVRVVSSVDKKLEVKQRFLEIFQEENYPKEFGYKSKVVLLFQKIEGVEVCLFGMYVQEFGTECEQPNHRRVYLSYLDSVKYFRPEIRTVTGEALRTFVYHEILIGYLEYCKLRGFTSCYIWACPPLKGEDYILYCHPEIQKTPKSDKLREWYLAMLRKASKENIVVELTNLYDHFFISSGECKAKVTAARLPYFDGDYWPGAAEDIIYQICQEEDGRKQNKRGSLKKNITKRTLKASGQTDLSGNASKDLVLMHRLGETISPMKEDFIMVHLQPACTRCCLLMISGKRWVCNICKNFRLCDRCHDMHERLDERERHPINYREKHPLFPVEVNDIPADTKDKDEILESEFFDTRQAFLSLCQGNHYQYDTLRRAKHSSMMVLYHLHNPTAPAFVTTCNRCNLDIETGQGWRCEVCPDFDVCNSCYYKDGGIDHPHELIHHPSIAERDAQNKEARQQRVVQLRKMLDLLVHASQCRSPLCQYPNCRKVKGLFRHGINCKVRASGGCVLCKRMWYLLQLHARACKESQCHVPRCRDLNEHLRRLQQQSDSRRRAAVTEMMRQRAAEVATT